MGGWTRTKWILNQQREIGCFVLLQHQTSNPHSPHTSANATVKVTRLPHWLDLHCYLFQYCFSASVCWFRVVVFFKEMSEMIDHAYFSQGFVVAMYAISLLSWNAEFVYQEFGVINLNLIKHVYMMKIFWDNLSADTKCKAITFYDISCFNHVSIFKYRIFCRVCV